MNGVSHRLGEFATLSEMSVAIFTQYPDRKGEGSSNHQMISHAHLRLEEGCAVRFVVREVTSAASETEVKLSQVGGRLLGSHLEQHPVWGCTQPFIGD